VAGGVAAAAVALIAGGLALAYVDRHVVRAGLSGWHFADVFEQVVSVSPAVVGFVLASRRPGNRIGWLLLAAGLGLGLRTFAHRYGLHALVAAPGSWPGGRVAAWLSNWIWVIPVAMLASVLLLFPTGRLRSRRWRPAAWFVGGAFALATVGALATATRVWARPFITSPSQLGGPAVAFAPAICVLAALAVGAAAVVVRSARSSGEERLQLKWFAAAAVLLIVSYAATLPVNSGPGTVFLSLAVLCLFAAIAVAVLKYRLYDIDLVISKAVLYGSLAVFITAVYAT
jgi:hypothetical protein